jgi:hypothetical protein
MENRISTTVEIRKSIIATAVLTSATVAVVALNRGPAGTVSASAMNAMVAAADPIDSIEDTARFGVFWNGLKRLTWQSLKASVKAFCDSYYDATGAAASAQSAAISAAASDATTKANAAQAAAISAASSDATTKANAAQAAAISAASSDATTKANAAQAAAISAASSDATTKANAAQAAAVAAADPSVSGNWNLVARQWPITGGGGPNGLVAFASNFTANASGYYNYTHASYPIPPLFCAGDDPSYLNFNRTHEIELLVSLSNMSGGGVCWFVIGEAYNQSSIGNPSKKGFGFKITTAGIALWVHDGTNLTVGAATAWPVALGIWATVRLVYASHALSGAINGTALAAASGGPSGTATVLNGQIAFQWKNGPNSNEAAQYLAAFPRSRSY